MQVEKLSITTSSIIPLMAALPYGISSDDEEVEKFAYDPSTQITRFAGGNFSTSRYDESAGGLFQSKTDTKKDD